MHPCSTGKYFLFPLFHNTASSLFQLFLLMTKAGICRRHYHYCIPTPPRIKHWRKHGGAPPEGVGAAVGQAAAILRKAQERRRGGFGGRGRFGGGGGPGGPGGGGRGGFEGGRGGFGRGRGDFGRGRGGPPPGGPRTPYGAPPGQYGPR
mmetsp:Transcript_29541/g.48742  ORF Transcript_29541/g.48742 Transcript_29541/m.48742 type:complete len:149 (+) Transcript_29541:318-764(+)